MTDLNLRPVSDFDDALESSGITRRQYNYWVDRGWLGDHLRMSGSGFARLFTPDDIDRLVLLGRLVNGLGILPHRAAAMVGPLRSEPAGIRAGNVVLRLDQVDP